MSNNNNNDNINITIENETPSGQQEPQSKGNIDKFLSILSESKWMQIGVMFMCIGIMYVMMTGGVIKVLGFTIIDTRLDNCIEEIDDSYYDGYYKYNEDTIIK